MKEGAEEGLCRRFHRLDARMHNLGCMVVGEHVVEILEALDDS